MDLVHQDLEAAVHDPVDLFGVQLLGRDFQECAFPL
jgi:hypothetical protein